MASARPRLDRERIRFLRSREERSTLIIPFMNSVVIALLAAERSSAPHEAAAVGLSGPDSRSAASTKYSGKDKLRVDR